MPQKTEALVSARNDEWSTLALEAKHDKDALEQLITKIRPYIMSYVMHRGCRSEDDLEDITQKACIQIAKHIHNYDVRRGKFTTWVRVIASRILINHNRDQRRQAKKLEEYKVKASVDKRHEASRYIWRPDRVVEAQQFEEQLNKAIALLEPHHRKTVNMILKGYNYEQIAEAEGVKMGTVKSRIFRARERLLNNLESLEVST